MSDAALLQLPCQTVHLELAMMAGTRAKASMLAARKADRRASPSSHLSLSDLFAESANNALVMYREESIGLTTVGEGS